MWLPNLKMTFFKKGLLIFIKRASRIWNFCLFFSLCKMEVFRISRHEVSVLFNEPCLKEKMLPIYIYMIYINIYSYIIHICIIDEGRSMNKEKFLVKAKQIFFSKFFSHKRESCFVWNCFITKMILISQKYLFWGYLKWLPIRQSAPGLNKGLSSNFWWLRTVNHVKFTEECVMCMEKFG